LPDLASDIDIQGPGASALTVRRNIGGAYRIFKVSLGAVVSITGLTISNGSELFGGGIYNLGNLTLTQTSVTSNDAVEGGGIYSVGMLTLNGSSVESNTGALYGGGIYNGGTLVVNNSTIAHNAVEGVSAWGGGIRSDNGSVAITSSVIADNS